MEKGPATANENSTGSGDVQSATKVPENVVKSCLEDKATELVEKHNDSASGSIVTDGSSAVNKQCTKLTVSEEGAHFTNSKDNGDVSVKTNNESLQTDSVGKETEGPKVSDKVILADEPIPKKLEPAEEKKSVTDEGEKIALASNEAKVSAKEESAVSEKTSTDNESAIVKESTSAMSEESLSDKTVSKEGVPDTGKMPSEEKSVSDTRKMPSEEKSVPNTGKMTSEEKSVPDTGKMPSEEKSVSDTGKMPSEEKSVSDTRKMPSGEKSVPDSGKMPSEEKSVPDTGKMPSEEKSVSDTGKMPSEEKRVSDTRKMPSGEKSVPDSGKMPSEEKSVPDTGKMPSEEKSVSDTGKMPSEEKSVSDTRKMPSGEKSVPDSGKMPSEEKSVPDTGKIPSEEKSVAAKEELDSGTSNKDKDAVSEAVQLDKECKSDQVAIDECISEEKVLPKKDGDSGKTLDNDSVSDETSISKSVTLEKIDTSDKEKVALTKESGSEKGTLERGHAPEKIDTSDKEKVALAKENGSEKETSERGHAPEKIDAFDKEKVALTKESGSEKETSEKGHAPEIVAEGEEKLSETDGVDKESKPVNAIIDKKIHDKESVTLEERTKSKEESSVKRSESESVNTPKVNLAKENTLEQVPTHINAPEEASIVINKVDVLSSTELDKNSASVAKETVSLKNKCIPENVALDNKSTPDKECISEKTIDKERTVAPEDIKAVPSVNEKALLPEGKDSVRVIGENSEEAHAKKDTSTNSISSDKVSTKLENKILDPVDTEKTLSEEPASINSSEKSEDDNIKIETPVKVENDEDLAMETSTNSAMETSTNSAMETSTNSDKAMDCDSESNCSEVHESITEKKHLQVISSEKSDENPPKLDENPPKSDENPPKLDENPPKSDENPPKSDEKVDNARKFTLDTSEEMRLAIDRVVRQRYPEVIEEEERERELRALSKASKPASENTKLFSEVHTPKYSPKPPVTPYDSDDSDNFFPPPSPTPVFPSTKNPVMGQSPKKEGTQLVETDSLDESQNPSSDLSKLEKQGSEISENNGDSSETEMENEVPKSVGKEIENSSAESKEKDESFSENQKQPPSGKADANSSKEMILPDESKKSETREPVALNKNQQREDDSKSVLLDEAKAPNTENKRSAQLEESAKPKTISLSIGEKPVGAGSPKAKDRESETENSGSEAKKSELVVDGEDDSQDDIFSQDTCNSKPGMSQLNSGLILGPEPDSENVPSLSLGEASQDVSESDETNTARDMFATQDEDEATQKDVDDSESKQVDSEVDVTRDSSSKTVDTQNDSDIAMPLEQSVTNDDLEGDVTTHEESQTNIAGSSGIVEYEDFQKGSSTLSSEGSAKKRKLAEDSAESASKLPRIEEVPETEVKTVLTPKRVTVRDTELGLPIVGSEAQRKLAFGSDDGKEEQSEHSAAKSNSSSSLEIKEDMPALKKSRQSIEVIYAHTPAKKTVDLVDITEESQLDDSQELCLRLSPSPITKSQLNVPKSSSISSSVVGTSSTSNVMLTSSNPEQNGEKADEDRQQDRKRKLSVSLISLSDSESEENTSSSKKLKTSDTKTEQPAEEAAATVSKEMDAGAAEQDTAQQLLEFERMIPILVAVKGKCTADNKVVHRQVTQCEELTDDFFHTATRRISDYSSSSALADCSSKNPSPSSTTSGPGPFALQPTRMSLMSMMSGSSTSSGGSSVALGALKKQGSDHFAVPNPPKKSSTLEAALEGYELILQHVILNSFPEDKSKLDERIKALNVTRKETEISLTSPKETPTGPSRTSTTKKQTQFIRKRPKEPEQTEAKQARTTPVKEKLAEPIAKTPENVDEGPLKAGLRVFARWTDRKYYSGKVKEKTKDGRWTILFDDGNSKSLVQDFIITVKELEKGQSVYAQDEDEEYVPGVITNVEKKRGDNIIYTVDLDEGKAVAVSRSGLFMTEDQAKILREAVSSTPKKSTPQRITDLSLENVLEGKRSRSRSKDVQKVLGSPGPSGVDKSASKKKAAPSVLSDSASDSLNYSLHGVDPESIEQGTMNLGKVKGVGRGSAKKNDLVKMYGPIPEAGSKIFAGKCFLLTHTNANRDSLTTSESEGTADSMDGSTDYDDTGIPFSKSYFTKQIEAGGGTVYTKFDDVPPSKYKNCYLVAKNPSHTALYLLCLAHGIPIVSHLWIKDCCESKSCVTYSSCILHAGWSKEKKAYVKRSRHTQILQRTKVGLISNAKVFLKFWKKILEAVGATVVTIPPLNNLVELSDLHVIVHDRCPPSDIMRQLQELKKPLVNTSWVVQCLINGSKCSFKGYE